MGGKRKLLRGHYNPVKWERKYPNLQWARLDSVDPRRTRVLGKSGRVLACASCIKQKKAVK